MNRRRFVFWVGFGLFSLAEKFKLSGLDRLAAATMRLADDKSSDAINAAPEHWTVAENSTWRWFQRESLIDGQWHMTGITTPINKDSGEPYTGKTGYLDSSLVPPEMRSIGDQATVASDANEPIEPAPHTPDPQRRARHGRPPSRWLRSLNADEIRIWLKTVDVPEAGVSGMTYWTHLTRDHFFDAKKIAGLTIDEQAKLHGAAHFGY
jgi:hypothetical protein